MKEIPVEGVASTAPYLVEFGFPAVEINLVNDGSVDIRASFTDAAITSGFLIKAGESRSWHDVLNQGDRVRIYLKSVSATAAFHGEALR